MCGCPRISTWENGSNYDNVGANGGDKIMKRSERADRRCTQHSETVEHLVAGCTKLAKSEYLTRHNRALMILAVASAKQHELVDQEAVWYEQR